MNKREIGPVGFDFFMAAPTATIQNAIPRTRRYLMLSKKPICSISGGSDSDIMLDMLYRIDTDRKVTYVFFDTGLEMLATKDHIEDLKEKYGIEIHTIKPKVPAAAAVKKIGWPFWSKQDSEYISRLQKHGFKWEDKPFDELYAEYPDCKAALRWWCNEWGENSRIGVGHSSYLKEYMIQNPPPVLFSQKCCENCKKKPALSAVREFGADLELIGVRKAEGGARSTVYKSCFAENSHRGTKMHFPIFWFTDSDKKAYCEQFGVVHSRAYTEYGCKRTGCAGCPFGSGFENELKMLEEHEPKLARAVENIFAPSYEYTRRYRVFKEQMKEKIKKEKSEAKKQRENFEQLKFEDMAAVAERKRQ